MAEAKPKLNLDAFGFELPWSVVSRYSYCMTVHNHAYIDRSQPRLRLIQDLYIDRYAKVPDALHNIL